MSLWTRRLLGLAFVLLAVYGMVCLDVVWRAHHAYREGEKALSLGDNKTAYVWYESACRLFTPPASRWSREACDKMTQVQERWINELKAQKIPYQDYNVD